MYIGYSIWVFQHIPCIASQTPAAKGMGAPNLETLSIHGSVRIPAVEPRLAGTLIVATVTGMSHWEQELASKVGVQLLCKCCACISSATCAMDMCTYALMVGSPGVVMPNDMRPIKVYNDVCCTGPVLHCMPLMVYLLTVSMLQWRDSMTMYHMVSVPCD